jgi:hypothetical protein
VTTFWRREAFAYTAAALIIGLFAVLFVQDRRFVESLAWDEWLTVEWYTWVGVTEAGEHRPVRRMEDFEALPAPSLRNLAIGFYCALGRWPEPNNHVVHSALVNLALAGRRTVAMTRVPALVGAMIFGLVMFVVCWSTVGWHAAAFPVLVLALGWPYTVSFAMNARGYTWALALQALWLLLALKALRQPRSIATGATMAAFAVASFVNVVSSAIMWVAPAYIALWMAKPEQDGPDRNAWRMNLKIQMLAIGAVGSLFVLDRLPALYSSSQQYGTPFGSTAQALGGLREVGLTFFPSLAWMVLGTLAVVGIAAGWNHSIGRIVAYMAAVIAIVDCLYILLSARFPYPRVMFHVIPIVLLGVGLAIEAVAARTVRPHALWLSASATGIALLFAAVAQPAAGRPTDEQREFIEGIATRTRLGGVLTYPVFGRGFDVVAGGHVTPRAWLDIDSRIPVGTPLQLVFFSRRAPDGSGEPGSVAPASLDPRFNAALIQGQTHTWPNHALTEEMRVFFWYPDPERLSASGDSAVAPVAASRLRYFTVSTRRVVKMDVYSRLFAVIVIADSGEEARVADTALGKALEGFGGNIVVFVADAQRSQR